VPRKVSIIGLVHIFVFLQFITYLNKEERIEIILLVGNRSQREAAAKFNGFLFLGPLESAGIRREN
jgi:hypothetical protein